MVKKEEGATESTQEKILNSARVVFMTKGMDGARMQEIADHAGINKALLHYYFRDKETLFNAVFSQTIMKLIPALTEVLSSDKPLLEKIPDFFSVHMKFIQENPMVPQFVISEISRNPGMVMTGFMAIKHGGVFEKFNQAVQESVDRGEIKPVDPTQLILNLVSLSIFPFVAKPILKGFFNMDDSQYGQMMEERKKVVSQFVINALK